MKMVGLQASSVVEQKGRAQDEFPVYYVYELVPILFMFN
jgi:hypothetical protein